VKIESEVDSILKSALEFAENSEYPDKNYLNEIFRIDK
jgi:hypothetical protein